jgi:hypothetical protein
LFTQWGAKHAPKIMAVEEGVEKRIFGWETVAGSETYRTFLTQCLQRLDAFIQSRDLADRCYFHVSDEPSLHNIDSYRAASEMIRPLLNRYPIIDALSDYAFYETGLVPHPIPANDHIEPFLAAQIPDLWTYYCCGQYKEVSNRFFAFPSQRNRIIGVQLYKYRIAGFLHWGYNFWYAQYSTRAVDPYRETDAGLAFASGDAYLVYPGKEGPVESIRLEVFYEALQDLRALQLLEGHIGRDAVLEMIEEGLDRPLTFKEYPRDLNWILRMREKINLQLAELYGDKGSN